MSGIYGIIRLDGATASLSALREMYGSVSHREPENDVGEWTQDDVALAHVNQVTTPEAQHDTQPLVDGPHVLVADARIDNRDTLIDQLGLDRSMRLRVTDSTIILETYKRWGNDAGKHLIGDYAFFVWNQRKREIFACRDTMGVRPFFYSFRPGRLFAFASQPKALLAHREIPHRINEKRVAQYLADTGAFFKDCKETAFDGIRRLPMNRVLHLCDDSIRTWEYWNPDFHRELDCSSEEEYAAAFQEVFEKAVSARMRSRGPVGSMLSGGLDSSSITCMARELSAASDPIDTYSTIYPTLSPENLEEIDERRFIETVIQQGGLAPHYIRGDQASPFLNIDRIVQQTGDLFPSANSFVHWMAAQKASEQGVRVILDGTDGDTVVSYGNRYLRDLTQSHQWEEFGRAVGANLPADQRLGASFQYFRSFGGWEAIMKLAFGGRWIKFFQEARRASKALDLSMSEIFAGPDASAIGALKMVAKQFIGHMHEHVTPAFDLDSSSDGSSNPSGMLHPRLVRKYGDLAGGDMHASTHASTGGSKSRRERHWNDICRGTWQSSMECVRAYGEAYGVEFRFPFFDRRVIETCIAMPGHMQRHQGWGRYVLRRAMEGGLPEEVRWRVGKANLGSGFTTGLLTHDRELLDKVIWDHPDRVAPFVDVDRLRRVYDLYLEAPHEHPGEEFDIYKVVVLDRWLASHQSCSDTSVKEMA